MRELDAVLQPHPTTTDGPIERIVAAVAIEWAHPELSIRIRAMGDMSRVIVPARRAALRADGLWQHTCFEAFLRADADDGYYELNFSPSGAWAAYRFSGRRAGRQSPPLPAPAIEIGCRDDVLEMSARVAIDSLVPRARTSLIHAGLAAVIEGIDGRRSYWALAHGTARPDFHDPRTFTLKVSTA